MMCAHQRHTVWKKTLLQSLESRKPAAKNTAHYLSQVLVLDFWTLCCINCMHVLPELAALESKYKGLPVAVVGVHSAKFDNEKDR